jgi:ankyrin repeat protein
MRADHGFTECAQMLMEEGADISYSSEKNISSLHLAVFKGHYHIAKLLIEKVPYPCKPNSCYVYHFVMSVLFLQS